jgi:cardiolipin synthase
MSWLIENFWAVGLVVVDIAAASVATAHVLLHKREPRAATGWLGLIWLSPLLGCLAYLCFGINRISRKAVALDLQDRWQHPHYEPLTDNDRQQQQEFLEQYPYYAQAAGLVHQLTGRPALPGNQVSALVDGDEAYPAMLQAIDGAERSITLLSYIFDNDRAGAAFLERLLAARKRGVEIRVLIDDVGSRYSRPHMIGQLQQAGLTAAGFLPTRVPRMFKYANLRNHRKLLVVDGKTGFTGGTNIREGHWLSLEPAAPVQCLHFQFDGPVVAQLQEVFAIDWAFATGESLDGDLWFPTIARGGEVWARGIASGPDEDLDKMSLTILGALSVAKESIRIFTPYFLPDQPIMQALSTAALRGVDVRIVLPAENNVRLVDWASRAVLPYLAQRGCRIYFSPPPFDHTKLFLVDHMWALVGSTNWDPRSLRLNFEFNVECYSQTLGAQLHAIAERRLSQAEERGEQALLQRSLPVRLRDGFARLFSPYL